MSTVDASIEQTLIAIWSDVLGVEQLDGDAEFFALGGNSLLATQITARASEAFGVELALDALFEAPTIAELAQHVASADRAARGGGASGRRKRQHSTALSDLEASAWSVQFYNKGLRPHVGETFLLQGALDVGALERSLSELVRRNEILRTAFPIVDHRPQAQVRPPTPVRLTVMPLARAPRQQRDEQLREHVRELREPSFEYWQDPPLRIALFRVEARSHALAFVAHELLFDNHGFGALTRELSRLYDAAVADGPDVPLEPPRQYREVIFAHDDKRARESARDYWRTAAAGAPLALPLPFETGGLAKPAQGAAKRSAQLPDAVVRRLEQVARAEAATAFMLYLAALVALLHRCTGETDLVVRSPAANRSRVDLEGVIGFVARVLPLRIGVDGDPSFRTLLRRTRDTALGTFRHADHVPEDNRLMELEGVRGLTGSAVLFRAWDGTTDARLELTGIRAQRILDDDEAGHLVMVVTERAGEPTTIELSSSSQGLDRAMLEALLRRYCRLLEAVAEDADARVGELDVLGSSERAQLVSKWNGAREDEAEAGACLHELVAAQARATPDGVAVATEDGSVSYGELDARATQLARHLRGTCGVRAQEPVALTLPPSVDLVVAMLAVLKAGGACLPLARASDGEAPVGGLPAARVVVTRDAAPARSGQVVVDLTADADAIAQAAGELAAEASVGPESLAFVLPTTGVTGPPKAVLLPHRALCHVVAWQQRTYRLTAADRGVHAPGIGASTWALAPWPYLTCGAQVVVPEQLPDGQGALGRWLEARQVSVAALGPALASACLSRPDALPASLRVVVAQGRGALALPAGDLRRAKLLVLRQYALAEAGGAVMAERVAHATEAWDGLVSEGSTAASARAYVLDANHRLLPAGVVGELHLAGAGLARGYGGDGAADGFFDDTAGETGEARLVATGDLARRRLDGRLELLGRAQDEVRHRGFRLNPTLRALGAALAQHPGVADAVARWDEASAALVAHVIPRRGSLPDPRDLDDWLLQTMDDWILPARYVATDAVPLRPDGSPDLHALARSPNGGELERRSANARSERKLASIWKKLLDRRVGARENFFGAGGNLILGIEMVRRAQEAGIGITPQDLMLCPTIAELVEIAERKD